MIRRAALALILLLFIATPVAAQGPGVYIRVDCATITAPTTGSVCFDITAGRWEKWTGSAWVSASPLSGDIGETQVLFGGPAGAILGDPALTYGANELSAPSFRSTVILDTTWPDHVMVPGGLGEITCGSNAGVLSCSRNGEDVEPMAATIAATRILCVSGAASASASTSEEVRFTCPVAANLLSANGKTLRVTASVTGTATATAKVARIRWGGLTGTECASASSSSSSEVSRLECVIVRRGAASQVLSGLASTQVTVATLPSHATATRDETVSNDLVVTLHTASGAGQASLQLVTVEVLN